MEGYGGHGSGLVVELLVREECRTVHAGRRLPQAWFGQPYKFYWRLIPFSGRAKQMIIHLCIYSSKSCPGALSLDSRYAGWTELCQVALVITICWSNMYLTHLHVA